MLIFVTKGSWYSEVALSYQELKICSIMNNKDLGDSLVVCACTVGNMIPGQDIKTPKAACVLVAQLCSTVCDPMDCSPPGFSVHGILQVRILEWRSS